VLAYLGLAVVGLVAWGIARRVLGLGPTATATLVIATVMASTGYLGVSPLNATLAYEALVHLDGIGQRRSLGVDHRPSQLVQDHPGCLIPAERELALQLRRRDPRGAGRHQVRRPEPQRLETR
jgi:hypothetical protein